MNKKFDNTLVFEKDDLGYIEVTYDAEKHSPGEIMAYIASHINAKDIRVSENSLSKVVKKIYEAKSY